MNKDFILPQIIANRFNSRARSVLKTASLISKGEVELHHLFNALIFERGSLASNVLLIHNIETSAKTLSNHHYQPKKSIAKGYSRKVENVIKRAMSLAMIHKYNFIGTEHLLLALLQELKKNPDEKRKIKFFCSLQLNSDKIEQIKKHLQDIIDTNVNFHNFLKSSIKSTQSNITLLKNSLKNYKYLKTFATELVELASRQKLPPILKRDREINLLIMFLLKTGRNNVLIIGDAGVGKTALVYGLAQKIANGQVPTPLLNKKIFMLNLGHIVAGTIFRGDLESRIQHILKEAQSSEVILFIDEIHNLIGAGSSQGSLDIANLIKPMLTDGSIRLIGATTFEEYRKFFEKDRALNRRFNTIYLEEMTKENVVYLLKEFKKRLETRYPVTLADHLLPKVIDYAQYYIPNKKLPDKALDLLDQVYSYAVLKNIKKNPLAEFKNIQLKINLLEKKGLKAIQKENYDKAILIENKIKEIRKAQDKMVMSIDGKKTNSQKYRISLKDIKKSVSLVTGRKIYDILDIHENMVIVKQLLKILQKKVIGQNSQLKLIINAIKTTLFGGAKSGRPLCSMLFVGPTGCGKTYTAKLIAETLFETPNAFIRFNMSEFNEPHTISRLIGSPPGYVGFEEGGELTEKIQKNPYALILFDEAEKAHPKVMNLLLQILEEGQIVDSQGRIAHFDHAIIILTSNVGSDKFTNLPAGFYLESPARQKNLRSEIIESLKEYLKPELLNRLDHIIVFDDLDQSALYKIAKNQVLELKQQFKQKGYNIKVPNEIIKLIVQNSRQEYQGARLIRKNINKLLLKAIIDELIKTNKKELVINKKVLKDIV